MELHGDGGRHGQNGDPVLTEGGASITATATITNGVTFASAQTVTLAWGNASLTGGYVVGAGNATAITIPPGQSSGSLAISSPDTDTTPSYTPRKEHDLTATHAGIEIGSVNLIRLDDEEPPVATIAAVPTTVTEGEDIAIEVSLNLPYDGARFVTFDVTDTDSALSGTKARFNSVFGYGDTSKTTTFSADDNSIQNDGVRTATVALYRDASRDYTLGDPSSVVVTVLDNDSPPTAPRNLTATAISETRIDLNWEEPVKTSGLPITGYRIEVSTDDSNWSNLAADTESTDTDYEHTGLPASTTRYYRVSAINAIGTGSASDAASATTRKGAFVPTANADGSTTLLEADMTVVSMAHGGGSLDSAGSGYYEAADKYGDLDPRSFIYQGTTIHIGAIQTEPGGTCAEDSNKGELTLWDGSGNWDDLGFVKPVLHLGSKTFAFADANEQTASFVKWHCVDDGDIGWSDGAMLTVKIVLANEPSAPTNLTATATYASEIDLRWDAPAKTGGRDINGYRIEVSTDSNTWTDLVADTESTDTDYRHTGLTAGSTRYYQVSAINAIGTGTASATASVTTSTVVGSALSADGSETLLTATLTVGQAQSSGVPLQTYGYSHGGGYGSLDDADFAIGSTTYTVAALVLDSSTSKLGLSLDPALGTRRARLMLQVGTGSFDLSDAAVTSLSSGGASYEWSNPGLTLAAAAEVAVKVVRLHEPGAPTGLTATARTLAQIDLEWDAPAKSGGRDITGYRIEVSTDNSLWTNLEGDTESTDTEYKHSGLTAGATRHYRVSALNATGTGSASDAASATTRKATFVPTENADGSTTVWMATLTVEEDTGYYGHGGSGYYNNTGVIGSTGFRGGLDPDLFTYNGVTHVFHYFGTGYFSGCGGSGENALTLWDGFGAKWRSLGFVRPVLHVGTRTFAFKDAADKTPGFVQFCLAAGADTLGWYDGYTETVRIVLANEPSAPTNLTARATYASEIDLGWDAPAKTGGSPIIGYKIEVSADGNDWTDLVADTEVDGHRVPAHRPDRKQHALLPGLGDQRHRHGDRVRHRFGDHEHGGGLGPERRRVRDAVDGDPDGRASAIAPDLWLLCWRWLRQPRQHEFLHQFDHLHGCCAGPRRNLESIGVGLESESGSGNQARESGAGGRHRFIRPERSRGRFPGGRRCIRVEQPRADVGRRCRGRREGGPAARSPAPRPVSRRRRCPRPRSTCPGMRLRRTAAGTSPATGSRSRPTATHGPNWWPTPSRRTPSMSIRGSRRAPSATTGSRRSTPSAPAAPRPPPLRPHSRWTPSWRRRTPTGPRPSGWPR